MSISINTTGIQNSQDHLRARMVKGHGPVFQPGADVVLKCI
jgi:hypothetical protein